LRAEVYTALAWLETIEGDEQRGQELGRCALQDARNAGSERAEGLAAAVVGGSGGQLDMLRLAADLARRRGDELQEASAQWLHARGLVEWGRPIEALSTAERALQLSRDLGDRRLEALVMGALAQAHHFARDPERALQWYAEAIALHAADGHQLMQGVRLGEMARIECELGRLVDARTHASESVRLTRDAGYPAGAAASQALLSIVSAVAGQHQEARALLDEAHAEAGEHPPVTTEVLLHAAAAWLEGDRARVAPVLDEPNGDGAVRVPIHVRAVRRLWEGVARTATEAGETAAVADPRALVVGHGAAWFALGEAEPVSLHRRQALRSILSALVEARQRSPGRAVDDETLIGQAWPAQRIARGSARNRLRNAISTLRRAGLKEVLLTRSDGYLLDPDRALRRRSEDPFNGD
jgi:tetratricopeptide (TPR) repeat protein